MKTVQSGWMEGHRIGKARKTGQCQYWLGADGRCKHIIEVGEEYVAGDTDPYIAGGFAQKRYCLRHFSAQELGWQK
jgi:hypothetical protein